MYEVFAKNVLRRLPVDKIESSLRYQGYDSLVSVERWGEDVKLVLEDAADADRLLTYGMTFIHRNYYFTQMYKCEAASDDRLALPTKLSNRHDGDDTHRNGSREDFEDRPTTASSSSRRNYEKHHKRSRSRSGSRVRHHHHKSSRYKRSRHQHKSRSRSPHRNHRPPSLPDQPEQFDDQVYVRRSEIVPSFENNDIVPSFENYGIVAMPDQPTPLVNEALLKELEVLVATAAPFIEPALQQQVNSVVQLSKRLPPFDPRHRGLQPLLMELLNTLTERCRTRVFAATVSNFL